ncbi:unnamed protein product [Camellia sinensis]
MQSQSDFDFEALSLDFEAPPPPPSPPLTKDLRFLIQKHKAARIAAVLIDDGIEFDKMHDIEWHRNFAPVVGRILRIEHLAEKIFDEMAIAEYLSHDLPYKLSPDDAFVTSGCTQAIDVALSMLARPGVNILLPRPGFPIYKLCAAFRHLEVRHFDLLPKKGWEVDLDAVEALADHNTAAMVIINPGNPCGNVYTYQHLKKIAETAKRLKILVIADEVYGLLAFGANPFVPMGVFGSVVPVLTLGSLSKRWIVPGWRLGWFVINDPNDIFRNPKIVERLKKYFDILGGPSTFIQSGASSISQKAGVAALGLGYAGGESVSTMVKAFQERRDYLVKSFGELEGVKRSIPQGALYLFLDFSSYYGAEAEGFGMIKDSESLRHYLLDKAQVALVPGDAFGDDSCIRISYASSLSSLKAAVDRIKKALITVRPAIPFLQNQEYIGDEYGTMSVLKYQTGVAELLHLPYHISADYLTAEMRSSEKRVSAVARSNDGLFVCFADKFGVVWFVDLDGFHENQALAGNKAAPILAHYCSIITSLL